MKNTSKYRLVRELIKLATALIKLVREILDLLDVASNYPSSGQELLDAQMGFEVRA